MKVKIEFNMDNAAFDDALEEELSYVFRQAQQKILKQLKRAPVLCDHPESDDVIQDSNGNTVGSIKVDPCQSEYQKFRDRLDKIAEEVHQWTPEQRGTYKPACAPYYDSDKKEKSTATDK
jgi:tetrahydromethanopterin S-methyltransferase subunit G